MVDCRDDQDTSANFQFKHELVRDNVARPYGLSLS